jgi:hypothetical protein
MQAFPSESYGYSRHNCAATYHYVPSPRDDPQYYKAYPGRQRNKGYAAIKQFIFPRFCHEIGTLIYGHIQAESDGKAEGGEEIKPSGKFLGKQPSAEQGKKDDWGSKLPDRYTEVFRPLFPLN